MGDLRDKINPDNTEFYARCGEHNVKAEDELVDAQETEVVAIRIHPDYDTKRVTYNLAIPITKDNFVYQEHIGPVCLPQPGEDFSGETECWSSGWGADAYDSSGFFSDILKKVQMPIVPRKKCQDQFRSHERFKGKRFSIHPSWMCVGGEKTAPLVRETVALLTSASTRRTSTSRSAQLPGVLAAVTRSPPSTATCPVACAG